PMVVLSPADLAREAGTYHLAEPNADVAVVLKEGKLFLDIPGQEEVTLLPVGGRRFRASAPAPDGVFVTFRPAAGSEGEMLLEDAAGGRLVLKKQAGFT